LGDISIEIVPEGIEVSATFSDSILIPRAFLGQLRTLLDLAN